MPNFGEKPKAPRTMDDILQDISALKKQTDLDPKKMEAKKEKLLEEAEAARNVVMDIDKAIAEIPVKESSLKQGDVTDELSAMAEAQLPPEEEKNLETLLTETTIDNANHWRSILSAMRREGFIGLKRLEEQIEKHEDGEIKKLVLKEITKCFDALHDKESKKEPNEGPFGPKDKIQTPKDPHELADMGLTKEEKDKASVMLDYVYQTSNLRLLKRLRDSLKRENAVPKKVADLVIERIDEVLEGIKIIDAFMDKGDGVELNRDLDLMDNPDSIKNLITTIKRHPLLDDMTKKDLLEKLEGMLKKAEDDNE